MVDFHALASSISGSCARTGRSLGIRGEAVKRVLFELDWAFPRHLAADTLIGSGNQGAAQIARVLGQGHACGYQEKLNDQLLAHVFQIDDRRLSLQVLKSVEKGRSH